MKDKNVAAILALFLGGIGVHKFYLGRSGWGILYLLFSWTMIPAFAALIEFIVLATMDTDEFNRRYNANVLPQVVVNMLPPAYPGYPPTPYGPGYPQHPQPGYGPPVGHPPHPGPATAPPAASGLSPDELAKKLEKLNELRIAGLLSEDEFNQQKARILGQA